MSQQGQSAAALEAARRALAASDADLADADRALAATVADVHAIAVESIGRIDAIKAEVDAAVSDQPKGSAADAHEFGRQLVAKNRDIAAVVTEAVEVAQAKTLALKELQDRYRARAVG
jgi:hypothetical protein